LLRLIEAVNLVYKQNRALVVFLLALLSGRNCISNLFYPRQDSINRNEVSAGGIGNNPSEGCFSGTRWTKKDQGRKLVSLNRTAQQASWANNVVLPDELIKGAGTHPGSEGCLVVR